MQISEQWRRNVYLLWVAVLMASVCWSMVMPFMPLFLEEELKVSEGAAAWAGSLGALQSMGMVLMAPVWGAVGDRFGRKLMMMRAGIVLTLAYFLMSLVTGPYQLLVIRVMIGMLTGFIPTATALVGTTTPQAHVGKALALVSTAGPTGFIVGPMLGGLLSDVVGIRGAMVTGSALIGIATVLVLLFVKEQFTPPQVQPGSTLVGDVREVLQHRTFAVLIVTTAASMASIGALEPVLVPYVKGLLGPGSPNWMAGGLYALPGLAVIFVAARWARLGERWGFATTLTLGLALSSLLVLPQAFAVTAWEFGGLRLAQGLAMASVNPGIAALIATVVPASLRGRAFGINQSAFGVGNMVGPLAGGFLATLAGSRWVFLFSALLLAGSALWTRRVVAPRVKESLSQL